MYVCVCLCVDRRQKVTGLPLFKVCVRWCHRCVAGGKICCAPANRERGGGKGPEEGEGGGGKWEWRREERRAEQSGAEQSRQTDRRSCVHTWQTDQAQLDTRPLRMTTSIESGTHPSLAAERFSHLSMSPDDAAADGAAGSSRNSFSGSPHGVLRSPRRLRILIVRHGETDCNVQGIIQGQLETDLNAVGREQARRVAKTLAAEHIDEVYASPLRRAHDTADAIVAAHPRFQAFAAAQAAEASAAATIEAEADAAAGVLAPASSPNSITSRTQRNRDSFQSSYSSAASPQRQNASSFSSISMAGGSRGGPTYWLDDRLKERAFGVLEGQQLDRSKPRRDSTQGIEQMTE